MRHGSFEFPFPCSLIFTFLFAQIKLAANEQVVVVATTFDKGVVADFYLEASASSLPVREERTASRNREDRARARERVCVCMLCV